MNCFAAAAFCFVTGDETDTSGPESTPTRSALKLRAPSLTVASLPSILKATIGSTSGCKHEENIQSLKHFLRIHQLFTVEFQKLIIRSFKFRGDPREATTVCGNDRKRAARRAKRVYEMAYACVHIYIYVCVPRMGVLCGGSVCLYLQGGGLK